MPSQKSDQEQREREQPSHEGQHGGSSRGGSQGKQQGQKKQQGSGQEEPDVLERVISWISALLLLGAIGFLVWEGITYNEPPAFTARVERIWEAAGRYYLELAVENAGGESVKAFSLEVKLQSGDSTAATASTGIAWLPARSSRRATVIFDKDPRQFEVLFEPKGYELP